MKTVIIDDEDQVREGLNILLKRNADIEIIGEANSVTSAKKMIENSKPELVFLDIQLNEQTAFDLLDQLEYLDFNLVFVTAYNEYAIKAFKYNAFDYLLKPINPFELKQTLNRIKIQTQSDKTKIKTLKENKDFNQIVIPTKEELFVMKVDEIIRCEAAKGYTFIYAKDRKEILSSKTLKEYEKMLPNDQFIRVHQSHLVNKNFIKNYERKGIIILNNDKEIPVSTRRRQFVINALNT